MRQVNSRKKSYLYTYRTLVSEFTCSNDWSLKINHYSTFNFGKLLSFLDHFNKDLVLFVLDGTHVDSEYIGTLFDQFYDSFL